MSLLAVMKAKLGLSSTPANNFTLTAEADNGTMKLARGNPGATTQDILTVDAAGKVDLPALVRSIGSPAGSYELPGGLVLKWGTCTSSPSNDTVTFVTPFATQVLAVVIGLNANTGTVYAPGANTITLSGFKAYNGSASLASSYIAIGK